MIHPDFLNDLWVLDLTSLTWGELTTVVSGTAPSPRRYHGFTRSDNIIYVFGGFSNGGKGLRE